MSPHESRGTFLILRSPCRLETTLRALKPKRRRIQSNRRVFYQGRLYVSDLVTRRNRLRDAPLWVHGLALGAFAFIMLSSTQITIPILLARDFGMHTAYGFWKNPGR